MKTSIGHECGSDRLTNSACKSYRACQRKYFNRYKLGYKSVQEAGALSFGQAFHDALKSWFIHHDLTLALLAIVCENMFDQVKAEEMMRGYHFMWVDAPLTTLAVEHEFEGPMINPSTGRRSKTWNVAGKLDAVVQKTDDQIWILEHKTSSEDIEPGSDYWKRLLLDSQISTYFVGARVMGYEPAGCLYDVIRKPAIRPGNVALVDDDGIKIVHGANGHRVRTKDGKKWRQTGDIDLGYVIQSRPETPEEYRLRVREVIAEAPEKFYQRGDVVRLEEDEKDAAADLWQIGRSIRESEILNRWPRNPDACVLWSRTCSYFGVCTRTESLEDPMLFKQERINAELSAPAQEEVAA